MSISHVIPTFLPLNNPSSSPSEVTDLDTGLLLEVWEKGMLWDKAIGYYWCPLNTIPFSKQVTITTSSLPPRRSPPPTHHLQLHQLESILIPTSGHHTVSKAVMVT